MLDFLFIFISFQEETTSGKQKENEASWKQQVWIAL